jgi:hypothetical protein
MEGCTLESSDGGDFDGMWQLTRIDSLLTGTSADMRYSQVVWCVQGTLLETRIADQQTIGNSVIFRFALRADSLLLKSPYISWRHSGDIAVRDASLLNRFGITRTEEKFQVQELTSSVLRLQGDSLRLYFRKY